MSRPEAPLLFMRVGTMASAPEGFCEELASEYDARLLSTKTIPQLRIQKRFKGETEKRHYQRRILDGAIQASVRRGMSTVCENFSNLYDIRRNRTNIAASCGASAVLLAFNTPHDTVEQRILDRYRDDEGHKSNLAEIEAASQLYVARRMLTMIEWPEDTGEEHLMLDGSHTTPDLLAEIQDYVGG